MTTRVVRRGEATAGPAAPDALERAKQMPWFLKKSGMNFGEAFLHMREARTVTRAKARGSLLCIREGELIVLPTNFATKVLQTIDLMAEDWELVP